MAWLGANSSAWGLGLTAVGVAADLFRWFYRFDWQTRRFVHNDLDARAYLAEVERLLTDNAAADRKARLHTKIVIAGCAAWFALLLPIVAVNTIWGDAPFCAVAPVLNAFDWVASQLVEVIRENSRRLSAAGLVCRSVYLEFFYSVYWYLLVVGSIFNFTVVAHFTVIISPVQGVRKKRVPDLDAVFRSSRLWRAIFLSMFGYVLGIFAVTWLLAASMKGPGTGRSWNIHESNLHLFMLPFTSLGTFVFFSMANFVYTACRADRIRHENEPSEIALSNFE
jgi:hypothetical protein